MSCKMEEVDRDAQSYFSQDRETDEPSSQPPKPAARRGRKREIRGCIVPGCEVSDDSAVNKARLCKPHQRALELDFDGVTRRFCQQCVRIHDLDKFHGNNRGCVARLKRQSIRERRRRADQRMHKDGVSKPKIQVQGGQQSLQQRLASATKASTGYDSDSVTDSTNASALEVKKRAETDDTCTDQTLMSNLAPQAPIPRVPLFLEGEGRAEMNYNGNNNNGSQMSGDVTESSAYKRGGGASGASTLSMYDNNGYGSGPGAAWRSWGPEDWASSAKMWQSYGNYSAAAQHWAASTAGASANSSAVWYGGDRQRYDAGFNAGASYTGGFSPETDSRAGVGETVDQAEEDEDEEGTPLDVPDEWKDNPAKMIMMGVEAPWNPPEERKAYELPAEIDYECAYMEGQAFGGSIMGFDSSAQDMNGNVTKQGMQGQDVKQMMINGGIWPMEGDDGSNGGYEYLGGGYHGKAYDYGAQAAYNKYGSIPGNNYGVSGASAAKMSENDQDASWMQPSSAYGGPKYNSKYNSYFMQNNAAAWDLPQPPPGTTGHRRLNITAINNMGSPSGPSPRDFNSQLR